jgi:glycosyltransferase involved in cell wall biosynthesis
VIEQAAVVSGSKRGPGSKPVILSIMGHYLPGWKGGGPVVTGAAAIDQLGGDFDFKVFCLDRDLGDVAPYAGVASGTWRRVGKAEVCYLRERHLNAWWRHPAARGLAWDLIWLHGLFKTSTITTLMCRRVGGLSPAHAVIVPHGELSAGALSIKPRKKAAFLRAANLAGLYGGLWWQATDLNEAGEITRAFPRVPTDRIRTVRNPALPATAPDAGMPVSPRTKAPGSARIVFLSRISRKKNLDMALRLLSQVAGDVVFDIFGPKEDEAYWAECQAIANRLPARTRVAYRGPLAPAEVLGTLSAYHAFLLPTRGENFGYVILEALQAGCLPIISDATPWRDLERRGIGWDLPLSEERQFIAALERVIGMGAAAFAAWSAAASDYGRAVVNDPAPTESLRAMFNDALDSGPRRA